ncbi:hypothetical protein PA7_30060 [Pseudonocardia asaccharolytica DSM 44247 = NBRC 16224]|uniref:factor independent urate hydroxylase n=1 Tax=Pseudonocardia asaccharolytica DSM 44247 = NBRC 16224 TaxID=1123024 RepID=A0A511D314_9PSEU|nr:hypothetical protein PA7_30060 [Pseudonocardia asaccharolytica DSM 44247 = NBRC 16224]
MGIVLGGNQYGQPTDTRKNTGYVFAEEKALREIETYAFALGRHFVEDVSLALQQTLWEMGRAVLQAHPEIAELDLSAPKKHRFLVDLAPFGLDNPGEVFYAADRPYGLIEYTVTRDES